MKKIFAYKCPKCGTLHYPAKMRCKKCLYRRYPEEDVEKNFNKSGYDSWIKVPLEEWGKATLLTHTRLWSLPAGYNELYLDFAVCRFENGLCASGRLLCENPEIGMTLKASVQKIREYEGKIIYGIVFHRG